jgi:hypothetical protein
VLIALLCQLTFAQSPSMGGVPLSAPFEAAHFTVYSDSLIKNAPQNGIVHFSRPITVDGKAGLLLIKTCKGTTVGVLRRWDLVLPTGVWSSLPNANDSLEPRIDGKQQYEATKQRLLEAGWSLAKDQPPYEVDVFKAHRYRNGERIREITLSLLDENGLNPRAISSPQGARIVESEILSKHPCREER